MACYSDAADCSSVLQGGNKVHQISALHADTPLVRLERHFSAGLRQFAAQLDSLELNLPAIAFNTQGINHLWQCAHRRVFLSFTGQAAAEPIVSSTRWLFQVWQNNKY